MNSGKYLPKTRQGYNLILASTINPTTVSELLRLTGYPISKVNYYIETLRADKWVQRSGKRGAYKYKALTDMLPDDLFTQGTKVVADFETVQYKWAGNPFREGIRA